MVKITFEYCDAYTFGKWQEQTYIGNSLQECIKIYGLGIDCEYKILNIEEL